MVSFAENIESFAEHPALSGVLDVTDYMFDQLQIMLHNSGLITDPHFLDGHVLALDNAMQRMGATVSEMTWEWRWNGPNASDPTSLAHPGGNGNYATFWATYTESLQEAYASGRFATGQVDLVEGKPAVSKFNWVDANSWTYNFGPDFTCFNLYGKVVRNSYQLPIIAMLLYLAYLFTVGRKYIQRNPFGVGSHRSSSGSKTSDKNDTPANPTKDQQSRKNAHIKNGSNGSNGKKETTENTTKAEAVVDKNDSVVKKSSSSSGSGEQSSIILMFIFSAWNFFLSLFSCVGVYYVVPYVYSSLKYQYFFQLDGSKAAGGSLMTQIDYASSLYSDVQFAVTTTISSSSSNSMTGLETVFNIVFKNTAGWRYLICADDMMFDTSMLPSSVSAKAPIAACYGMVGAMMSLFMLSKLFELFDTILLISLKKRVAFLHWYHHATVLMYGWHAYTFALPTSLLFGVMNYCVHSIMYFYFGVTGLISVIDRLQKSGKSLPAPLKMVWSTPLSLTKTVFLKPFVNIFRMPITMIQLSQMIAGCAITYFAYSWTYEETSGSVGSVGAVSGSVAGQGTCSATYLDSYYFELTSLLYVSYLFLFGKLFVDSYIVKPKSKKVSAVGAGKPSSSSTEKQKTQ